MRYTGFILLVFITTIVHGQNAVKVYANVSNSFFSNSFTSRYMGSYQRTYLTDVLSPSVAITLKNKRKNYHELELSRLSFHHNLEETQFTNGLTGEKYYQTVQTSTSTVVALRYEYILALAKKKKYRLQPSLGFAAMPYYSRNRSTPHLASDWAMAQTNLGIRTFIVPRVNISLSRRIFLDLNVPICLMDMGTSWQHIADPALSVRAQKYNVIDLNVLPDFYSVRLGLGLKL